MFLHLNTEKLIEPAQFYAVDLPLNCADEVMFSSTLPFNFIFSANSLFSFPANHTCPLLLISAMFCQFFVYQMSAVCGGLPRLWSSTEFLKCSTARIAQTEYLVSWVTQIMTVWAKGLQLKTAVKKSINVYSIGLYGPTMEKSLRVLGWCEGDECFSSSRWRLWTHNLHIWAQQPIGKIHLS